MKHFVNFISEMVVLISCSNRVPAALDTDNSSQIEEVQKSKKALKTGWYYIGTAEKGVERT